jgi:hypothetical protein
MNVSALRVIRSWISLLKADAGLVLVTIAAVSAALTTAAGASQRDVRFDRESISFLLRTITSMFTGPPCDIGPDVEKWQHSKKIQK